MSLFKTPTASATAREDRANAAAEARLRNAKTAIQTLSGLTTKASEKRKAMARQKVEQLKARLQMLQSMASADPKGAARLAAQLARELGAAVKAYAAAGGSIAGMNTGVIPTAAEDTSAPASASEPDAGEEAPAAPVLGDATDAAAMDEDQADGEEDASGKPANPYQQAIDEANARAVETTRRSGEKQADKDFLGEVRKLGAQIKQLVRQAADGTQGPDAVSPAESREMKSTVAAMEREIEQASADLSGSGFSLLV
jgi:hypothetical protein